MLELSVFDAFFYNALVMFFNNCGLSDLEMSCSGVSTAGALNTPDLFFSCFDLRCWSKWHWFSGAKLRGIWKPAIKARELRHKYLNRCTSGWFSQILHDLRGTNNPWRDGSQQAWAWLVPVLKPGWLITFWLGITSSAWRCQGKRSYFLRSSRSVTRN